MDASISRMRKLRAALLAIVFALAASLAIGVSQPAYAAVDGTWTRLAGDAAPDTMQAVVEKGWSSAKTVVLTTNGDYADALSASSVAGMAKAPVVMTDKDKLNDQAKTLLAELKPTKIIVIGGTSALTDDTVKAAVAATGVTTTTVRLSGDTRYETADAIMNKAAAETGGTWSDTAFVCRGDNFKDALSASPIAYANSMPIVLANREAGKVSDSSLAAMKAVGVKNVYVLGGTAALPDSVVSQLQGAGYAVERIAGATGVDTSNLIAKLGVEKFDMSADNMAVSTDGNFRDALAGGALCGLNKSVMLLVNAADNSGITDFVKSNADTIVSSYIFGGEAAVSPEIEKALNSTAPGATVTVSFVVPEGTAKPADQTIAYNTMVRDQKEFAYPELQNAAGESIFWYTDQTYTTDVACGPKSSWTENTTLYGKFHPYFTVTIQGTDGKAIKEKSYTKAQFAELAKSSEINAANPASCQWNGTNVSTAIEYVTVEQLVKDTAAGDKNALAIWEDENALLTYAASDYENTRTVGDFKNGKFFPDGTADNGTLVPAGFGLNWKSKSIGDSTAGEVQKALAAELAKEAAGASQAPRMMYGVTDDEFKKGDFPRGMDMLSNVMSITIALPESVTVTFEAPEGAGTYESQEIAYKGTVDLPDTVPSGATSAGQRIAWYTDEECAGNAVGPKTTFGKDTTLYGKVIPYFTFTVNNADGSVYKTKEYKTQAELAALAASHSENLSNIFYQKGAAKIQTATVYVTIEEIMADVCGLGSGDIWTGATAIAYGAPDGAATARTIADLKSGKFYSADGNSSVEVAPALGLTWASNNVGTSSYDEVIAANVKAATSDSSPRLFCGQTDNEKTAGNAPAGNVMWSSINTMTVTAGSNLTTASSDLVAASL